MVSYFVVPICKMFHSPCFNARPLRSTQKLTHKKLTHKNQPQEESLNKTHRYHHSQTFWKKN